MWSRRQFLATTVATTAFAATRLAAQAMKTLQMFTDGDTTISDWWNNILKPMFGAANPGTSST